MRFGFCDIQYNQGLRSLSASADNTHLDLDYSGYQKKTHPIIDIIYLIPGPLYVVDMTFKAF